MYLDYVEAIYILLGMTMKSYLNDVLYSNHLLITDNVLYLL